MVILVYILLTAGAVRALAADTQSDQLPAGCQPAGRQRIEYPLPSPGMLTDHPLYFLKLVRDKILEYLITDQVKKVEFDILQADKFLSMSEIQFRSPGKTGYVAKTLTRSAEYSEKALADIEKIKTSGKSYRTDLKEKLLKSIGKHIEVTTLMTCENPSADSGGAISGDIARLKTLFEKASGLK